MFEVGDVDCRTLSGLPALSVSLSSVVSHALLLSMSLLCVLHSFAVVYFLQVGGITGITFGASECIGALSMLGKISY